MGDFNQFFTHIKIIRLIVMNNLQYQILINLKLSINKVVYSGHVRNRIN